MHARVIYIIGFIYTRKPGNRAADQAETAAEAERKQTENDNFFIFFVISY